MRGILAWALITVIIVLVMLAAYAHFWIGAVEASTRLLASTQALHIAGIRNTIQTAPDDADKVYELPLADCEIRITSSSVEVVVRTDKTDAYKSYLLRSGTNVPEKTAECSKEEQRALRFSKKKGSIYITVLPEKGEK